MNFILWLSSFCFLLSCVPLYPAGPPRERDKLRVSFVSRELSRRIDTEKVKSKAEEGDLKSQIFLGEFYRDTGSTCSWEPSHHESIKWFKKAAKQGYIKAYNDLGYLFARGSRIDSAPKDYDKAEIFFKKAAENRLSVAYRNLCIVNFKQKKYYEAYKNCLIADKENYKEAESILGILYYNGWGTEQDRNKAFKIFSKTKNSFKRSELYYAISYLEGHGVKKNTKKAIKLLEELADLEPEENPIGNDVADIELALMYYYGKGIEKDYGKALKYFNQSFDYKNDNFYLSKRKSCQPGIANYMLGEIYLKGLGAEKKQKLALFHYQEAAEKNYDKAADSIKEMHNMLTPDDDEILYNLAVLHEKGKVIPKDYTTAYMLYYIAEKHGGSFATHSRSAIKHLTPNISVKQKNKAIQNAKKWLTTRT